MKSVKGDKKKSKSKKPQEDQHGRNSANVEDNENDLVNGGRRDSENSDQIAK